MSTPYFEKYLGPVTVVTCPGCGGNFRMVHFRKWWGSKRMLRTLCVWCEPEKRLSEMMPEERANALVAQRFGESAREAVSRMNEKESADKRYTLSRARLKQNNRTRRLNWSRAITHTLVTERAWAERNLQNPASEEWERFFEAYARVLKDALERINIKLRGAARGASRGGLAGPASSPLKPTMEEVDPARWIFPETLVRLKDLYSVCPVIRGRKPYRSPAMLAWG